MNDLVIRLYTMQLRARARFSERAHLLVDERGEGVISAAIAVLITAFLGVAVWVGFRATLDNTQDKVDNQIEQIGE